MRSLADLQRTFVSGLTGNDASVALTLLRRATGAPPSAGYSVYRGNVRENARLALAAGYPVTAALGGEAWFDGLVGAYLATRPSRGGDLHELGAALPAFLAQALAATPHDWFAQVALLERGYQEAMRAPDAQPLAPAALATVATCDHGRLVFDVHPGLRTVAATVRVLDVWRAHQADGPDLCGVDVHAGSQFVACLRRSDHVELAALALAPAAVLQEFGRGRTLSQATDAALAADPQADLGAALRELFAAGYLCAYRLA